MRSSVSQPLFPGEFLANSTCRFLAKGGDVQMYLHRIELQIAPQPSDRSAAAIALRSRRAARAAERALRAESRAERRQRRSAPSRLYAFFFRGRGDGVTTASLPG